MRETPRRYFNASDTNNLVNIQRITDLAGDSAVMLVPFDVDEDGRMDILVQKTQNGVKSLSVIYNNFQFDSFFVKAMMLSQTSGEPGNLYGAVTSGASFRFAVTTLDDKK